MEAQKGRVACRVLFFWEVAQQGYEGRLVPEPLLLATLLHSIPTTLLQEYQSHKLQCVGSLGAGLHRQP